jgi:hypothetical protein
MLYDHYSIVTGAGIAGETPGVLKVNGEECDGFPQPRNGVVSRFVLYDGTDTQFLDESFFNFQRGDRIGFAVATSGQNAVVYVTVNGSNSGMILQSDKISNVMRATAVCSYSE